MLHLKKPSDWCRDYLVTRTNQELCRLSRMVDGKLSDMVLDLVSDVSPCVKRDIADAILEALEHQGRPS